MTTALSLLSLILMAVTMGLSLAHALEFPGKARLDEATYRAVQAIYYPGFTIGGLVGEVGGMLALAALLFVTPVGGESFWWTTLAFLFLLLTHATYWVVTHPVNSAWLKNAQLTGASRIFFNLLAARERDFRGMRNAWEGSHVVRACLALVGFVCMALALIR